MAFIGGPSQARALIVIIAACFAEPSNLRGATRTATSFLSEKPKTPQLRYVSIGAAFRSDP
jgi:hypothetical protein